jgi:hypothetical protein
MARVSHPCPPWPARARRAGLARFIPARPGPPGPGGQGLRDLFVRSFVRSFVRPFVTPERSSRPLCARAPAVCPSSVCCTELPRVQVRTAIPLERASAPAVCPSSVCLSSVMLVCCTSRLSVIRLLHRAATSASKDGHPSVLSARARQPSVRHLSVCHPSCLSACLLSFAATSLWPLTNCKKLRAGYSSEGPLVILCVGWLVTLFPYP